MPADPRYEAIKHEFMTVPDSMALAELLDREPYIGDNAFYETAEGWLAEAEHAGASDMAAGLRERLEVLRELLDQNTSGWREAIDRFAAAQSIDDLAALARDIPLVREQPFLELISGLISEAEQQQDHEDAQALKLRLEDLQNVIIHSQANLTLADLLTQMREPDPIATAARTNDPEGVDQAERQALALLSHLTDQSQLISLISQAPLVLDEPFLARVEQAIANAELANDADAVEGLRTRLRLLRQMKMHVQVTLPQTLEAFAQTRDGSDLLELAQRVPFMLEDGFIEAVERAINGLQAGGSPIEAKGLQLRLNALREIRAQQRMAQQSPIMQALINFLNAPDQTAAADIFALQRDLLTTDEAETLLREEFSGGNSESQQRIEERTALLATLRQMEEEEE
jgi:hypothetical protein